MKKNIIKIFLIFFLFSGASALIFEVLWQRFMVLVFGTSSLAIIAILTAFLCGIAFGSLIGGQMVRRSRNPYYLYAYAQFWICVWGLSVPILLNFVNTQQAVLLNIFPGGGLFFFAARFIMALLVVLPATLGMGATIPIMNRIVFDNRHVPGASISLSYGMNTLGSVLGCLAAGFIFIPFFGLKTSSIVAAGINLAIFITIIFILKPQTVGAKGNLPEEPKSTGQRVESDKHPLAQVMISVYLIGGFLALGYEILWFRIMGILATNSIITYTVGLAVYLLGFGAGSLWLYPELSKKVSPLRIFFWSNWGAGLAALGIIPFYYIFPEYNFLGGPLIDHVFTFIVVEETFLAVILMFLPTMFMGLSYPAVCQLTIKESDEFGQKSGFIYFLGTIAAAFGAMATGLWLIARLNLMGTMAVLCAASLVNGLIVLSYERKPLDRSWSFFKKCSILSVLLIAILSCYGLFGYPIVKFGRLKKNGDYWVYKNQPFNQRVALISYKSGVSGTVSVQHATGMPEGDVKMILVDDQPVAATEKWSQMDAKLLAHIPLMLHPAPKRAITVGYGAGVTSWSMTRYGIETDCVEIEQEVYRATHYFSDYNHFVNKLLNFHIIINDARNHFHLTSDKYDVISTDVTNLNYKNNSSLYTKEYFELLRAKLAKGGIASAWVPMGGLSGYDFRILLKTFQSVFPHTSVWFVGRRPTSYFAILVATPNALEIDYQRVKNIFKTKELTNDLKEIDVLDPLKLISFLLLDEFAVKDYTQGMPLHTDDRPILEFQPLNSSASSVDLDEIYRYAGFNPMKYIVNYDLEEKSVLEKFFDGHDVMCDNSGYCKVIE